MIQRLAVELGLDTKHMVGQSWGRGISKDKGWWEQSKPLDLILVENSTYQNTNYLRKRLIAEGIKEHRCECCGNTEWMNRLIPIQLEHVNGDRSDNRIGNLKLLCPNCHAQTPTYCGKNMKKYKKGCSLAVVVEWQTHQLEGLTLATA